MSSSKYPGNELELFAAADNWKTYVARQLRGHLRGDVLEAFDVDAPVYAFDLDVQALLQHLPERHLVTELPRFPAVKRDLSLLLPPDVSYDAVQKQVVTAESCRLLPAVAVFEQAR